MINLIDYNQLISDLIPDTLLHSYNNNVVTVNEKEYYWNILLCSGTTDDNNTFLNYAYDTYFKVYHNGQLQSLEHFLNNEWLNTLGFPATGQTIYTSGGTILTYGQIYISDGPSNLNTYLYMESETIPPTSEVYLYEQVESGSISGYTNTYLYEEAEIGTIYPYDFIVYMQTSDYNNPLFYTLVDKAVQNYKPAGTTYQLVAY